MKPFEVTVEGKIYDVDAPDERTAWQWANDAHTKFKTAVASKMTPAFEMEARNPASSYSAPGEEFMPFMAGMGKGMTDVARGIGQMAGVGPSPEEMDVIKQRDKSLMQSGAGMIGNIGGGAAMAAPAMAIPGVNTVLGGALAGGAMGAAQPVGSQDSRGMNALGGAVLGGGIPLAISGATKAASAIGGGARNLADMVLPGGGERILSRYQDKITGPAGRDELVRQLRGAPELVPGSNPTAAEAIGNLPQGSPLIAHQKITAGTPGGISAQFGQRKLDQDSARIAAELMREQVTGPMRTQALRAADMGGVQIQPILAKIDAMADAPGASTIAKKTMNSIKNAIEERAKGGATIGADDLYTIRKEIGNTIATHAKDTANWDKRLAAGLQKDVQATIDDAMEAAGGSGWKDYLAEFSKRSQAIADDKLRSKLAFKPPQTTNLQGGINVAEEVRTHAPNILSRPMMLANYLLKKLGSGVEPKIDAAAAARYLDPKLLADALEKAGQKPTGSQIAEMLRRYQMPITGGAVAPLGD